MPSLSLTKRKNLVGDFYPFYSHWFTLCTSHCYPFESCKNPMVNDGESHAVWISGILKQSRFFMIKCHGYLSKNLTKKLHSHYPPVKLTMYVEKTPHHECRSLGFPFAPSHFSHSPREASPGRCFDWRHFSARGFNIKNSWRNMGISWKHAKLV